MEYMGTKEAAEKWGYAQGTIAKWCKEGKISLVVKPEKKGGQWRIPVNAECPRKEERKNIT
ncbi:MAG: helix-turn-helix domain-containing protein [Lachnospiraceae bacterium]|nr:helix-turn-helix domain-containing protein [Lachnospiraceae bacterium]